MIVISPVCIKISFRPRTSNLKFSKLTSRHLKSPCFLLNKNINFNKNETGSKMESPTQSFSFVTFMLSKGNFLIFVFYLNV